jgi:hypothetical protein
MISTVPNPHPDSNYSGAYAASFAVSDLAVHANCPMLGSPGHPNAVLTAGAYRLYPDTDFFLGFSVYLPASFPPHICWDDAGAFISSCWMQLMEIYGAPYAGASPIALSVLGGNAAPHTNQLVLSAPLNGVSSGSPSALWRSPPLTATGLAWQGVTMHVHLSRCGGTTPCSGGEAPGFVELWYDGVQQHFFDGSTRVYYATLTSANFCASAPGSACGYDSLDLQQYRGNEPSYTDGSTGATGTYTPTYPANGIITDDLAGAKLGTTYSAVAPH